MKWRCGWSRRRGGAGPPRGRSGRGPCGRPRERLERDGRGHNRVPGKRHAGIHQSSTVSAPESFSKPSGVRRASTTSASPPNFKFIKPCRVQKRRKHHTIQHHTPLVHAPGPTIFRRARCVYYASPKQARITAYHSYRPAATEYREHKAVQMRHWVSLGLQGGS